VRWADEQRGCTIIDFRIDPEANVYPMIPSGASVNEIIEAQELQEEEGE
jgi:acetolactate synthase-1/2/3 large subunit